MYIGLVKMYIVNSRNSRAITKIFLRKYNQYTKKGNKQNPTQCSIKTKKAEKEASGNEQKTVTNMVDIKPNK